MENSEKQMTPEESLNLIGDVISRTRNNLKTDSFFFLLWGWSIIVADLLEAFILWNAERLNDWKNVGLFSGVTWCGIVLVALLIHYFYVKKHYVNRGYRNFFEKTLCYLWIISGFIIFLIIYISFARHEYPEPYILALITIPTVVTGAMTRFRPLVIGGLLFIIFAVIAVNVKSGYLPSLVSAVALICGYLIPGYLLRRKN